MKIITWNVNGLRAGINKDFWSKLQQLSPDIFCLQEIKTDDLLMKKLILEHENELKDWHIFWHSATKKGYSGTAILYKKSVFEKLNLSGQDFDDIFEKAEKDISDENKKYQVLEEITGLGNEIFDTEGRTTGLVFSLKNYNSPSQNSKNTQTPEKETLANFLLLNCYYPQGGRVGRVDYKIDFYQEVINFVNRKQTEFGNLNIILTGDFNTTFADIDLARPKENRKTTGCLPVERDILNKVCQNLSLVDVYRFYYPQKQEFTYWDQITRARERNVGWRIDYFLVLNSLVDVSLVDNSNEKTLENSEVSPNSEDKNNMEKVNLEKTETPKSENSSKILNVVQKVEILGEIMGSDHCPVCLEITD